MPIDPSLAQHHPNAGASPQRKNQEALLDTFPASDPVAQRGETGARAVLPHEMTLHPDDHVTPENPTTLVFAYADREKAKLALEQVVREIPVERHLASLDEAGDAAVLRVISGGVDLQRVAALLERAGGTER